MLPAVLVGGGPAPAIADPAVSSPAVQAGTAVYADDLDTTVISPQVRAEVTIPAGIEVEAHWNADVISSASVDIVTTATRISEVRNEVGAALRREGLAPNLDVDVSYAYSIERDAYSHTVQGGLHYALLDKNLEVAVRLGTSFNRLGEVAQPVEEWRTLWVHNLDLAATFVIDSRTTFELVGSGFSARGYQAGPYRRVPIVAGRDLRGADWLPESVPDDRLRGSGTLRLRRAVGQRWVVSGEYRLYADDWGILAHTETLAAVLDVGGGVSLRARELGTVQSRARFYRSTYPDPASYRTRDRRLAPHESLSAGLAVQWDVGPVAGAAPFDLLFAVDGLAWHFSEFLAPWPTFAAGTELRPLRWVRGLSAQFGVQAQW